MNYDWKQHYTAAIAQSNALKDQLGVVLDALEKASVSPGSTGGKSELELGILGTRHRSLARTKIEEAIMWLEKDAKALGEHPWAK